ncbi:hypothetical protein FSP39_014037, partial [Pinctada imbricata]
DPGFSFCWDNVQKLSITRHPGVNKNSMMIWALCFATQNRISFSHEEFNQDTISATEIPLNIFLPSKDDFQCLRERMEIMVQHIIVKYFDEFKECTVPRITHEFTEESDTKSHIVNLGVIQENPSTCKGTIEILKYLHRYVPQYSDGKPYQTVCSGDQLSVERMIEAKLAMACSEEPSDRLDGLVPRPQGFHKRNIVLQDAMNMLYDGRSTGDLGSLIQIRNTFHFNNVKKKVADNINHAVDFWNFVTEAFICSIVCKILNVLSVDEKFQTMEDKQQEIKGIAIQVVDKVWPRISFNSIRDACEESLESTTESSIDHVCEYTRAVVWQGLKMMCQRDAERENNGNFLMIDWRVDMVDFWNNNHYKYLILGHRLLSDMNGLLPERLAQEIKWNSTANLSGLPGHNIALDLVNEFLNNEFKTNLKECHGRYTDKQIHRCSKLVGKLGKDTERIYQYNIVQKPVIHCHSSEVDNTKNIKKFLELYMPQNMLENSNTLRSHRGFHDFVHRICIKNPKKLSERLSKYRINLANEQYVHL